MGVRESLEEQTMNMAKATAALLTEKLRHACGAAGRVCHFRYLYRGYGSRSRCLRRKIQQSECRPHHYGNAFAGAMAVKPSTWIQPARKPFGALTALNVPALFTWQRLWQLTARKASRHSPFTVMTFQDADDTSIPADVEEKLLRFARAGLAVANTER